ncbi:MAG: hypothetical protein AVDCRST_MAG70-2332 [uncultured Thermomicrobiales bacterium]|uniref:Uncharacterized protein n=1 Tax=uncultured Thermomicrobiales bacterium TaxID=1645740 RepID=A0A6J4V752_9BACT|nr:MAG: hypothetical protein AVDCRST_MAG70-2332 [uncultured Thermomicrobiales bacterium]
MTTSDTLTRRVITGHSLAVEPCLHDSVGRAPGGHAAPAGGARGGPAGPLVGDVLPARSGLLVAQRGAAYR